MGKPHFSYARIKPKQDVLATSPEGVPQEYRATVTFNLSKSGTTVQKLCAVDCGAAGQVRRAA